MSAKSSEQASEFRSASVAPPAWSERRKRGRVQVHWPVWFSAEGNARAVEAFTRDLSSSGFYVLTRTPFVSGERRECTLGVPSAHLWSADPLLMVACKIQVVRVQPQENGLYGVGCRIQDYRFTAGSKTHDYPGLDDDVVSQLPVAE